jgi:hypothetical protein
MCSHASSGLFEPIVHPYGAVPPLAASCCRYAAPTCPLAMLSVEMANVPASVPGSFSCFVPHPASNTSTEKIHGLRIECASHFVEGQCSV